MLELYIQIQGRHYIFQGSPGAEFADEKTFFGEQTNPHKSHHVTADKIFELQHTFIYHKIGHKSVKKDIPLAKGVVHLRLESLPFGFEVP